MPRSWQRIDSWSYQQSCCISRAIDLSGGTVRVNRSFILAGLGESKMWLMATLRCAEPSDLECLVELFMELASYDIALGQRRPLRWSVDPTGFARSRFAQALRNPS